MNRNVRQNVRRRVQSSKFEQSPALSKPVAGLPRRVQESIAQHAKTG